VARADPSKLPDMLAAEGWTVDKSMADYALLKADWDEVKKPKKVATKNKKGVK
jgi:hypothetical protein